MVTEGAPDWESESSPPRSELADLLGVRLVSGGDGTAVVECTLDAHHVNAGGTAHGGLLAVMLDAALGAALVSTLAREVWCGTAHLSTSFLEAAPGGSLLTARGRVIRRGRTLAHCAGEITDQTGRTIATATGEWVIWAQQPAKLPGRDST